MVVQNSRKMCEVTLCSADRAHKIKTQAIMLPQLTHFLPTSNISHINLEEIKQLRLADPNCFTPNKIDMVIGSDLIPRIILQGLQQNISGSLIAQNTIFGWILSGPIQERISTFTTQVTEPQEESLNSLLKKFWDEEEFCEDLYQRTTTADGRYMVKLPIKPEFPDPMALGHSRLAAQQQYISIERTVEKKPGLCKRYSEVLEEYITMDHMEPTSSQEVIKDGKYFSFYLPHHAVIKPDSKTTKVRVVFNASRISHSGNSLNDVLYTGPTLQNDSMLIILRWRLYKFVFNGDIE
ncbi:PREDICTED: uncharacterized protein LOC108361691 [Rhagoletis zephyria]|uniref:uncharacterized protein LOC108361691 n=1 Tax=Rhagoletis zephyria TaxID=28612 RepID=UPI0008117ADA|nr:PREDICTED: uncharacterized protein LOC108361691 [Rhagoletis zephyria]